MLILLGIVHLVATPHIAHTYSTLRLHGRGPTFSRLPSS